MGSNAHDLQPLGAALARERPDASVVSVRSPRPSDLGQGWQWFSVHGVTETNRPERVSEAMPDFVQKVASWQRHTGIGAERTTLIGFSQGAIMALEATQLQREAIASRIVAIAGRFARPPRRAPAHTAFNFMQGEQDRIMPVHLAVTAEAQLRERGAQMTLDRFPGLGHAIDARVLQAIVDRMAARY